ncbi:MAG: hypothetical protein ACOYVD_10665 [Bacillota bacterium]
MEKQLENIYKEEYIRAKARFDYEKNQKAKQPAKNHKPQTAFIHTLYGAVSLYILYQIYLTFI